MLSWVVSAARPLLVYEFAEAVAATGWSSTSDTTFEDHLARNRIQGWDSGSGHGAEMFEWVEEILNAADDGTKALPWYWDIKAMAATAAEERWPGIRCAQTLHCFINAIKWDILDSCGCLLEVVSNAEGHYQVQVSHHTVQTFLLCKDSRAAPYDINREEAARIILETMQAYVLNCQQCIDHLPEIMPSPTPPYRRLFRYITGCIATPSLVCAAALRATKIRRYKDQNNPYWVVQANSTSYDPQSDWNSLHPWDFRRILATGRFGKTLLNGIKVKVPGATLEWEEDWPSNPATPDPALPQVKKDRLDAYMETQGNLCPVLLWSMTREPWPPES